MSGRVCGAAGRCRGLEGPGSHLIHEVDFISFGSATFSLLKVRGGLSRSIPICAAFFLTLADPRPLKQRLQNAGTLDTGRGIGSTKAVVGETFINLGIIPGDGGAWFLQRIIGYQQAAEITFTGRMVEAEETLKLGIFLELTEPEGLLPGAQELAGRIAAKPPHAVRREHRISNQKVRPTKSKRRRVNFMPGR
ncbi:MAG: hypothetical protein H7Y05_09170 [Steroidobacteraceae bacterium]|nr:hypothetical protein [Deltaproteobacteria bacterium]